MKIIRVMDTVTVVLNNGEIISSSECTDEMFVNIYNNQTDENYVKSILIPEFGNKQTLATEKKNLMEDLEYSQYLTAKGSSVYLLDISELSVPEDLVEAILLAEKEQDEELIQSYLNFWTLVSLNPDSRCRQNLFWFLNKYGMTISRSGLFVAYRNVKIKRAGVVIDPKLADFVSLSYARVKFVVKNLLKTI